jgi:hypothetical protein
MYIYRNILTFFYHFYFNLTFCEANNIIFKY